MPAKPKPGETPFTREVKAAIRRVPRGRVATYGQVAAMAGRERAARGVAWILHSSAEAAGLPWHRIIGGEGRISLPRGRGFEEQKRRLVAEGVAVGRGGRIDLKRYQWEPAFGAAARSRAARNFLQSLGRKRKPSKGSDLRNSLINQ
ncbi:MAG TPA: MGMT family protein [Candidatus Bathyarchaeia archaeon]|nr:MGMT family protein [Candidatus Bathyarchaeia archaeon]